MTDLSSWPHVRGILPSLPAPLPVARDGVKRSVASVIPIEAVCDETLSRAFLKDVSEAADHAVRAYPKPLAQWFMDSGLRVRVAARPAELLNLTTLFPEGQESESLNLMGHLLWAWLTGRTLPQDPADIRAVKAIRELLRREAVPVSELLTSPERQRQAVELYFQSSTDHSLRPAIWLDPQSLCLNVSEQESRRQIWKPELSVAARKMRFSRYLSLALADAIDARFHPDKPLSQHAGFRSVLTRELSQAVQDKVRFVRVLPPLSGERRQPMAMVYPVRVALPMLYDEAFRELLAATAEGGAYQPREVQRHFPQTLKWIETQLALE